MVIVLNSYEKRSFIRFFLIYVSVFLLLFTALASLYYFKEYQRLFQEQKLEVKLKYNECKLLNSFDSKSKPCKMANINIHTAPIFSSLFYASLISLIFILPVGFILARLSLKPIRDSVDAMDSFINGIVHDINTPLSIVKLNAQSINRKLDDEKLIAKNKRIIEATEHIEALEEQLLFVLRIHHYELQKNHFNLYNIIQERQAYWNDIRKNVNVVIDGDSLDVNADERTILRMIDNVVINAIKYSNMHQSVKVVCKDGKLIVSDYGAGIKNPKKIFDKYYRESTDSKGLGLGLYVVSEIAKMHNIDITISSKLGLGTAFSFDISSITHKLHKKYV